MYVLNAINQSAYKEINKIGRKCWVTGFSNARGYLNRVHKKNNRGQKNDYTSIQNESAIHYMIVCSNFISTNQLNVQLYINKLVTALW